MYIFIYMYLLHSAASSLLFHGPRPCVCVYIYLYTRVYSIALHLPHYSTVPPSVNVCIHIYKLVLTPQHCILLPIPRCPHL